MQNSGGQSGRAILGRAKPSPQGDGSTQPQQTANSNTEVSCATESTVLAGSDSIQAGSVDLAMAAGGPWNVKASEFVPNFGPQTQAQVSNTAALLASVSIDDTNKANTAAENEEFGSSETDAAVAQELALSLDRLAKAPGSYNDEIVTIVSIFERLVITEKQVEYAADSIVQYAIALRSFTYDAASLCQHISISFRRQFGQKHSVFRDFVLRAVHKEHKQLDTYLLEGARDQNDSTGSADGAWAPQEYRTYVNGLVQFTGFLFMNLLSDRSNQRITPVGFAVRSAVLKLLRFVHIDYLDSILIVLKECGRALSELEDKNGEWAAIIDSLDRVLAKSLPGASLILTDPRAQPAAAAPAAKAAPVSNGGDDTIPCLRISVPLRNQLRRFVDQARGWTPSSTAAQVTAPAVPPSDATTTTTVAAAAVAACFEFDPDEVDASYIDALPTGLESIADGNEPAQDDDAEVDDAYEQFAAAADGTSEHKDANADGSAQRSDAAPEEDYDAELDSFLATIPK